MFLDGGNLRRETHNAGLRMQDLAKLAGVSRCNLSAIFNGKSCRESTARHIADALGVPLEKLVASSRR